jgi:hypothetical protein
MSSTVIEAPTAESTPERRPIVLAILVAVGFLAVSTLGTLGLNAAIPSVDGKNRDLIVELILAGFVLAFVGILGWRRDVGINGLSEWRHLSLLILPLIIVFIPFVGGFESTDSATLAVLLIGYAANSIAEDGMFRGIIPRVLRSRGLIWVVVVSSLLFGLAHFGNILSRPDQSVAITAAQAVGAFSEGIGLVAIRLATRTVIPVMVIHFLSDLFLQLGGFPTIPANVIQSVVMLIFGVWILRRYRRELAESGWE